MQQLPLMGKTYQVEYYNLDAILSVGYRVNSKQGTRFRIWATQTLREHILRGYTVNEKRLRERGFAEAEQAIALLSSTLKSQSLVTTEGRVLEVPSTTRTWRWRQTAAPFPTCKQRQINGYSKFRNME
jgi:hypothetical protein